MTRAQERKIQAEIKAELSEGCYAGYGGGSEFLHMNWKQFCGFCKGTILVAIGEGQFDAAVHNVITFSMAYDQFHAQRSKLIEQRGLIER